MTATQATTEAPSPNGGMSLAERRQAARDAYRASLPSGRPLTGADLGRRFGQSDRWGRDRITEVRNATSDAGNGETATRDETPPNRDDRPAGRDGPTTPPRAAATSSTGGRRFAHESTHAEAASPSLRATADHGDATPASSPAGDGAAAVTPAARRLSTLAVLAVALVAVVASYDHQRVLAELAGEGWRAWMLPASVDGLVVAASIYMLVCRRAGLRAGGLTWLALLGGIGASLAANVAAAEPTVLGRLVAAWPPLAFAVSFEMAMRLRAIHHQPASEGRTER